MSRNVLHKGSKPLPETLRKLFVPCQGQGLVVNDVPAEQLIRSFPGENDFHLVRSHAVYKIQGRGRGIGQGLIHVVLDFRELFPVFFCADHHAFIVDAKALGKLLRIGNFVVGFIIKSDGKGVLAVELRGHVAGIHTAGQKRGNLYVADHVIANGFLQGLIDLVNQLFVVHRLVRGSKHGVKIAADFHFSVFPAHIVTGHQLKDSLEKGLREH